jgi:hypothetical protein
MKKHNVLWIVVDCVRNYRSGVDYADRIEAMDKFVEETVEFTSAVTSSLSSILTASII